MELKDISGKFNNMLNQKFESFYDEISQYMLGEFKSILESLQKGDIDTVNSSLAKISQGADIKIVESEIFQEIGKLTRELHNDITSFVSDVQPELEMLSDGEVSQATTRLESVIKLTEASANSTLDLSEELMNENNKQFKTIQALKGYLSLLGDNPAKNEIRSMLLHIEQSTQSSNMKLMEIMTAQEFQDRVGQTLKKVIALVENVEGRLVHFVEKFGGMFKNVESRIKKEEIEKPSEEKLQDAFSDNSETVGQDDVNDLLAEFGF